jgi:large subunit ribosomal protein L4
MPKIDIKDTAGKKVGSTDLADGVFGIEPNTFAVHQVVRSQQAARRAGTHNTLTRGKVSGGGKKPWRQKGTGRARQGSTRSPQWAGGGVVFGPHPRSYGFKVQNKVVKLAMRSALSAKLADEALYVVDGFSFETPSSKQAAEILKTLGITPTSRRSPSRPAPTREVAHRAADEEGWPQQQRAASRRATRAAATSAATASSTSSARKDGVPAKVARSSTTRTARRASRCCTTPTARSATSSRPP